MPEPLPNVGVLLACFWQMHKFQIHKLVSRRDHLNISTMYSVFDWKEFEILSYRQTFLESTEISTSEELNALEKAPAQFMALRILSGKGEVQIMPFRKLSGKFHFLLQFCTSNWSETYVFFIWNWFGTVKTLHKIMQTEYCVKRSCGIFPLEELSRSIASTICKAMTMFK